METFKLILDIVDSLLVIVVHFLFVFCVVEAGRSKKFKERVILLLWSIVIALMLIFHKI